jgi:hypothetical protein
MGELEHLARHYFVQPMHARDTVAQRDYSADLVDLDALLEVLNLLAEQLSYLVRINLCHAFLDLNPARNPFCKIRKPTRSPAVA